MVRHLTLHYKVSVDYRFKKRITFWILQELIISNLEYPDWTCTWKSTIMRRGFIRKELFGLFSSLMYDGIDAINPEDVCHYPDNIKIGDIR